jgi:two-component system LytT family response regulator
MKQLIKVIIVDDEEDGREILNTMLTRFCDGVEVLGEASNVEEAVKLVNACQPDIVFLDIEMPRGNGFNLFYHFDKVDFEVVFTTAYSQYAIKALRMSALDYLLKPIDIQELRSTLNRYREKNNEDSMSSRIELLKKQYDASDKNATRLALPTQDGFSLVEINQIVRMEADGSYTIFIMENGEKLMVSKILKEYNDLLADDTTFIRVHRSHLINSRFIKKIIRGKNPSIEMSDTAIIGVSASKKDVIFKDLLGA